MFADYSLCNGYLMKPSTCLLFNRFTTGRSPSAALRLVAILVVTQLFPAMLSMPRGISQEVTPSPSESNASTPSAEQDDAVTLPAIRKTLRDLEASELSVRDQAEKELVAMGPSVLAFLPEVTARTSGEMKVRLQRIRQSLQQTKLENYFEASLVTLSGTMTLSEAIAQLTQQTKNAIQLQNAEGMANVDVEFDIKDQPFWVAVGSLLSQTKLRVSAFGTTESELVLAPGGVDPTTIPPPFTTGPFRMDMLSIKSTKSFNSPIDGQLDLSFLVSWEPRLKPVFMQIPMSSLKAETDDGKTLAASNQQAAPEIPLNLGGCSAQIDLQLERPERSTKRITKLNGEFSIAVPSDRHEYVFQKFGNGARQSEKYGDVTVTLEGARRNGAVFEMRVFVEFGDSQGALDSFRGWILSNEAYLRDAKDTRIENVGLNTYAITGNAVGIAYLFQINGDPNDYKLVYESPAAITKQKVVYELKDIDLP